MRVHFDGTCPDCVLHHGGGWRLFVEATALVAVDRLQQDLVDSRLRGVRVRRGVVVVDVVRLLLRYVKTVQLLRWSVRAEIG